MVEPTKQVGRNALFGEIFIRFDAGGIPRVLYLGTWAEPPHVKIRHGGKFWRGNTNEIRYSWVSTVTHLSDVQSMAALSILKSNFSYPVPHVSSFQRTLHREPHLHAAQVPRYRRGSTYGGGGVRCPTRPSAWAVAIPVRTRRVPDQESARPLMDATYYTASYCLKLASMAFAL